MTATVELPPAVKKAQEEGDRKLAEFQQAQKHTAPEPIVENKPPKVDPQAEPIKPDTNAESPKVETDSAEEWKQKYATLSGKYTAEVPRLQAEVRNLHDIVQQLRSTPPAPAEPVQPKSYVSEEERKDYGELLDISQRIARDIADENMDEVSRKTAQAVGQVQDELRALKHREFLGELDGLVPKWREINKDALWLSWLGQPDPLSGLLRQQLLDRAEEAFDSKRAALFFNEFLKKGEPPAQVEVPGSKAPLVPSLVSQVQPRVIKGNASPVATPAQKVWTTAETQKIANDIARGRYDSNTGEAERVWTEIEQAYAEGRVQVAPKA